MINGKRFSMERFMSLSSPAEKGKSSQPTEYSESVSCTVDNPAPMVLCPVVRGSEHLSELDDSTLKTETSSFKRVMDKA